MSLITRAKCFTIASGGRVELIGFVSWAYIDPVAIDIQTGYVKCWMVARFVDEGHNICACWFGRYCAR